MATASRLTKNSSVTDQDAFKNSTSVNFMKTSVVAVQIPKAVVSGTYLKAIFRKNTLANPDTIFNTTGHSTDRLRRSDRIELKSAYFNEYVQTV
jgi:hypothetical protein